MVSVAQGREAMEGCGSGLQLYLIIMKVSFSLNYIQGMLSLARPVINLMGITVI